MHGTSHTLGVSTQGEAHDHSLDWGLEDDDVGVDRDGMMYRVGGHGSIVSGSGLVKLVVT